jgi:O-antigen/teichoic acid export membrane protein
MIARGRTTTRHLFASLRGSGAASVLFNSSSAGLLRLCSSVVLTRVLSSYDYGIVGIIISVSVAVSLLSEIGLHEFVLRHGEGEEPRFLDQIWTLRLVRGVVLTGVCVLIAHPAAALLEKPELAPVIAVWGVSFAIDACGSLASVTAVRNGQAWRLTMMDLVANVAAFVVSLGLSLLLRNYWGLVIGMLASTAARSIGSYWLFPDSARRVAFDRARARELWGFSRYLALSSALALLIMQWDKLVLARLMPLSSYGLYSLAVTLAASSAFLASSYVERILAGTYARVARTERGALRRIFYDARRRMALLHMGTAGALIGGAPLMIAVLYDPRYAGAALFFQLIAVGAVLRLPVVAATQVLVTIGRTRAPLIANVARIVWLTAAAALGIATGKIMLLIAMVGTIEVPGLICLWIGLYREKLLDLREESYGLLAAVLCGVAAHYVSSGIHAALPWL